MNKNFTQRRRAAKDRKEKQTFFFWGSFAQSLRLCVFACASLLRYRLRIVFNYFIGSAILFLAFPNCQSGPPPYITDPGQIIYLGYKDTYASCARCHGEGGSGTLDAPDIRNAIQELGRKEVRKVLVYGKPKSKDWKEEMPAFGEELTPKEIGYVLDFITHWGKVDSTGEKKAE